MDRVRLPPGAHVGTFFQSNWPGYRHPVSSELENSGIRVVVGDCSVTKCRRWRPPYQTGKTVHVHAKHYKQNKNGRTAPGVCGKGSVPLSHSGNIVTRIGKPDWTDIPVPRLWMCSAEVQGKRLWENGNTTTNNAITRCQTWISIPHMVACAELPYKKSNFMPVIIHSPWNLYTSVLFEAFCQQSLMGNRRKADDAA